MGKSKFPGKPSKSQHKKRISVLTGEVISEGDVSSFKTESVIDRPSVLQKTFGDQDDHSCEITETSATTDEILPDLNNENPSVKEVDMQKDSSGKEQKLSARIRNRQKIAEGSKNDKHTVNDNKKGKKSVTFRSVLESYSDSVGSKKKIPFNHDLPLISIIKKNSLKKSDSIVKPSKLTDISAKFSVSSKSLFNQKVDLKCDGKLDKDKEFSAAVGGFVLPVRSAHSSRVIKPNKRFIETEQQTVVDVCKLGVKKPRLPVNRDLSQDEAYETCDSASPHSNDAGDDYIDNNNSDMSMGTFLWHTLRPNVDKQMFSKKMAASNMAESENNSELSDRSSDSEQSQDMLSSDESSETGDSGSELDVKHIVQNTTLPPTGMSSMGKNILRKARLQLQDTMPVGSEGPFSTCTTNNNLVVSPPGTVTCGVCGAVRFYRFVRQARKFGIFSCESCRKFISKMVKKQAVTSLTSEPTILQCHKGDGFCHVPPIVRSSQWKLLRCAYKARCPACWLKLCLRSFQMPYALQSRLIATLPSNMRDSVLQSLPKLTDTDSSQQITKLFPSRLALLNPDHDSNNQKTLDINACKRVPRWSQDNADRLDTNLQETILDEMSDMIKSSEVDKPSDKSVDKEAKTLDKKRKHVNVRVRKKEIVPDLKSVLHASADATKRQRLDLKGPRVKHVCRSASIVLGQPIATFTSETDTEPISSSTSEAESSPCQIVPEMKEEIKIQDTESIFKDSPDSGTVSDETIEVSKLPEVFLKNVEMAVEIKKEDEVKSVVPEIVLIDNNNMPAKVQDKAVALCSNRISSNKDVSGVIAAAGKKGIRNLNSHNPGKKLPNLLTSPISVDFWENYDPAEVSKTGFGLIGSDFLNLVSLCFLCGASGTADDRMVYCSCCCEPYHRYCVEDNLLNYNCGTGNGLDVTAETSMFDISVSSVVANQNGMWRLNWLCPRCTVCQSCGLVSGTKLSCRKCHRSYHSSCVDSKNSKRLIGSDRPWICPPCLKCKSCGSSSVAKYIGNMPLCSSCFKLRQKGSFCPLCQRCYEDNDYNTKMMECGECKRWIHANCEGLSDEKYQLLSALPESIEFICRKCFHGTNSCWRDAIDVELKNGFQSILRALSKNREACALLKWSPRKNQIVCSCQPIISAKSIQFSNTNDAVEYEARVDSNTEKLPEYSISTFDYNTDVEGGCEKAVNKNMEEQKAMDVELQNAVLSIEGSDSWKVDLQIENNIVNNKISNIGIPTETNIAYECTCIKTSPQIPSLLDIKRKVICNEYTSLTDFNSDMVKAIEFTNCEDLYNTYYQIVHDSFPWFTNNSSDIEDKIPDDDSKQKNSNETYLNPTSDVRNDQEVPCNSIPFDGENYFYDDHVPELDLRQCLLCKGTGDGIPSDESRLLYSGHNEWVHANCALWSAEVFEEIDGSLQNVHSAISRGKLIRCAHCNMKGASVGCCARNCSITFHYQCARSYGCAFMDDKTVYCPSHIDENSSNKSRQHDKDFEINRPVYVELDRKKKKFMEINHVQFLVGSLRVKNLGKFVPILSDTAEVIVPLNFVCTRMFWSTKEPWKITEYTIKTSVYIKKPQVSNVMERNFTVDHSQDSILVQNKLNEIVKFHRSVENEDQTPDHSPEKDDGKNKIHKLAEEKTVKLVLDQMLDTVCKFEDEVCDEEPQNTADLLSPELEDEIYEDLERDLLDGISMLDIFPKLMSYDDFVAMDTNSNRDLVKDKEDTSENTKFDVLGKVRKDVDNNQNDSWFDCKTSDLIDDLFTTSKCPRIARELKRSKSEVLPYTKKITTGNRSHQRSCSLTWSCKLDGNVNFKRRKIQQNRSINSFNGDISQICQELKTPEVGLKNLIHKNMYSIREPEQKPEVDVKSSKAHVNLDKLKISQLDGTDDASDGSEYGSPTHRVEEYHSNEQHVYPQYIETSNELPVKCERCHCTYRTHDSFQRHLATCETLTSESESELPNSPEMQQENMNPDGVMIMQNITTTNTFIPQSQQQNIQNISIPMQNHQNQQMSIIPNFNIPGNQIGFNNNTNQVVSYDLQNGIQMIAPGQNNIQFNQTQKPIFAHPQQTIQIDQNNQRQQSNMMQSEQNITQFQQNNTIFPMNITNQMQPNQQIIQTLPNNITLNQIQQHPMIIKQQNGINYQTQQQQQNQNQPRIITFSQPQQILTSQASTQQNINMQPFTLTGQNAPIINFTVNQPIMTSPQKKQLILPQTMRSPQKRQTIVRMPVANQRGRGKTQARFTNTKRPIRPDKQVITNQGIQLNRPMVVQQNQNPSIIVQQLSNPNVMSYVEALQQQTGNVQYITTLNSENEFKQPTQYLTPNPLVPGTFQLHTDQGNLLTLSNHGGVQVLPGMQLAQPQPTVLGTIIQPQSNIGMMSDQLLLQPAPLEMVTDASGCMYLTSQPVYYGLETIVQNTVMQSQQFVSTAMQGMLSSNSSFSATTTQVFQASKIEPIVEVPAGYVVVNNLPTDNLMQAQPGLIQSGMSLHPQSIQSEPTSMPGTSGIQSTQLPIQFNAYEPIHVDQKLQNHMIGTNQTKNNLNIQTSALLLPKMQNQIVNKVIPSSNQQIRMTVDDVKIKKINPKDMIQQVHFGNKNQTFDNTQTLINPTQNNMQFSQIHFNKQNASQAISQGSLIIDNKPIIQKSQVVKPAKVTTTPNKMIKQVKSPKSNTHLVQPIQNKSMPLLNVDNPSHRQVVVMNNMHMNGQIRKQRPNKNQNQQIVQPIIQGPKIISNVSSNIQLPNTLFTQPNHCSSIPTNIVNPIQQVSNNLVNSTPARPMNRVLPMQTSVHKENSNNKPLSQEHETPRQDVKLTKTELETIVEPVLKIVSKDVSLNFEPSESKMIDSTQSTNVCKDKNVVEIKAEPIKNSTPLKILNTNIKPLTVIDTKTIKLNDVTNIDSAIATSITPKRQRKPKIPKRSKENDPKIIFEVHSQDGFSYTSNTVSDLWFKVIESVQQARKNYGLTPLPHESVKAQLGYQTLGLDNNALRYLLEQLPGVSKCVNYKHRYHKPQPGDSDYDASSDVWKENLNGAIRCEVFRERSDYDMFSWLASRHRQRPVTTNQTDSEIAAVRRATSTNLPIAMRFRYLKETSKESVGVFRSLIHGRGLFCRRDIESGEMVIEYAGEVIRATLTDKREKYYDGKGIGCYMFRIDDQFVVDATMRGNAARFINHSCEPNCYSKVIDVLGHKHIVIFALRRILQGEELTYDYKFPFEDIKIPCTCGSRKCRKYLN